MPKHVLAGTFEDEQALLSVVSEHRDPASFEVELALVDLSPPADIDLGMAEDRLVERVFQSRLHRAVQEREPKDTGAVLPERVQVLFEADLGFRQRPRLV